MTKLKHENCLECAEEIIKDNGKDFSLLERMSIKTKDFEKVRKHKVIKDWNDRAENGEIMRII